MVKGRIVPLKCMFHAAMATQIEKDHYTLIEQSVHTDVKITITKTTTV